MPAAPDRLSALDAAFLDLETGRAPLHIGWTLTFDGGPPSLAALRRQIDSRLPGLPRFRRRVVEPPLGLGDPHWADDAGFDVARHVHALRLAAPAGPAELRELAGVLLADPLDRTRPLWCMTLVTGLRDGGFALVGQAHHALVDGAAALELAALLLDPARAPARRTAPARWTPAAPPSAPAALGSAVRRRASDAPAAARSLTAARGIARAAGGFLLPAPGTTLERSLTRERSTSYASAPLEDVRAAAHRHRATVNDALLAATAVALGAALARRGEHPPAVRALVPASTRGEQEHATQHGNRVSFLAVDLPLGERDPARVLKTVALRTRARKRSGESGAGDALLRSADLLPAAGRGALARAVTKAARFTLTVSSVTGPAEPLALLGRELTGAWPAVPLLDGHALSIGALSYAGRLHCGIFADALAVPDATEIARDLERALDALRSAPPAAATPWRARARARRDAARAV